MPATAERPRWRRSVEPHSAITESSTSGGNTFISTPTGTKSAKRRSDSGFLQPARGGQKPTPT